MKFASLICLVLAALLGVSAAQQAKPAANNGNGLNSNPNSNPASNFLIFEVDDDSEEDEDMLEDGSDEDSEEVVEVDLELEVDEDDAADSFGVLDLDDPEDEEDIEHRWRRHHFCWRQCVAADQCKHHKKEFEDEQVVANNGSSGCPAKVHRCDSCLLDCKARHVKCGAEAMHLTVEQVRKADEQMAVAAVCDKCNLRSLMQKCKPKRDDGEESIEDDRINNAFTFNLSDDEWDSVDVDDMMDLLGEDDDKARFFRNLFGDSNEDDEESAEIIFDDRMYNVTEDLDGKWRPRKCEIPVKKIPAKKRQSICSFSKCIVAEAKKAKNCATNAAPVFELYQKSLDSILKCKAAPAIIGVDEHDDWSATIDDDSSADFE